MTTLCTLTSYCHLLIAILCLATEPAVVTARGDDEQAINRYLTPNPANARRQRPAHEVCYRNAKVLAAISAFFIATHIFYPPSEWCLLSGKVIAALISGALASMELYESEDIKARAARAQRRRLSRQSARRARRAERRAWLEDLDRIADDALYREYLEELRDGKPLVHDWTFDEFVMARLRLDEPASPLYRPGMTGHERSLMPPSYEDTIANQERLVVSPPTYQQALSTNEEHDDPPSYERSVRRGNERLLPVPFDQQELEEANVEHIVLPISPDYSEGLRRRNVAQTEHAE